MRSSMWQVLSGETGTEARGCPTVCSVCCVMLWWFGHVISFHLLVTSYTMCFFSRLLFIIVCCVSLPIVTLWWPIDARTTSSTCVIVLLVPTCASEATTSSTTSAPTTTASIETSTTSVVKKHGFLKVVGNQVTDESGAPVRLRGMSLFWSQWKPQF